MKNKLDVISRAVGAFLNPYPKFVSSTYVMEDAMDFLSHYSSSLPAVAFEICIPPEEELGYPVQTFFHRNASCRIASKTNTLIASYSHNDGYLAFTDANGIEITNVRLQRTGRVPVYRLKHNAFSYMYDAAAFSADLGIAQVIVEMRGQSHVRINIDRPDTVLIEVLCNPNLVSHARIEEVDCVVTRMTDRVILHATRPLARNSVVHLMGTSKKDAPAKDISLAKRYASCSAANVLNIMSAYRRGQGRGALVVDKHGAFRYEIR